MTEIDLEAVQKCLESDEDPKNLLPPVAELNQKLEDDFPKWMLYLSQGFNVLLQRILLEKFTKKELLDEGYTHFVIRGYESGVSLRLILMTLANNLNVSLKYSSNSVETVKELRRGLQDANYTDDLIMVIHSLDGPSLRDDTTQNALSLLASIPNFHVIASTDHVNTFCLWDEVKLTRFRWIYQDATTYRAYARELAAGESEVLGLSTKSAAGQHSLASLDSVWAALSTNSRKIFVELVRYLVENRPSKKALGTITFWQLYQVSRGEFLVSSEAGLSHVMVEFQDHNVVRKTRSPDGAEGFSLAVQEAVVKEFLGLKGFQVFPEEPAE